MPLLNLLNYSTKFYDCFYFDLLFLKRTLLSFCRWIAQKMARPCVPCTKSNHIPHLKYSSMVNLPQITLAQSMLVRNFCLVRYMYWNYLVSVEVCQQAEYDMVYTCFKSSSFFIIKDLNLTVSTL